MKLIEPCKEPAKTTTGKFTYGVAVSFLELRSCEQIFGRMDQTRRSV
jgi:hypothetical protein